MSKTPSTTGVSRFQRLAVVTTAATFFLIAVGGFVRAAGAGLGCPDWPRCFGRWIPPTDASQLPADIDPAAFNFTLAWIEYVNRLVGVTVGFLILAVGIVAWQVRQRWPGLLKPAVGTVLLVAFQGWFGGQVVAYELDPRFVTVHLLVALAIAGLLLHLSVAGYDVDERLERPTEAHRAAWLLAAATLVVSLGQTVLGALVRGGLELLFDAEPTRARDTALQALGPVDELHKATAVLLLLLCGALYASAHLTLVDRPALRRWAQLPVWLAVAQAGIGVGLASRGLPPALQLGHLAIGSLLVGSLILVALLLAPRRVRPSRARAAAAPVA